MCKLQDKIALVTGASRGVGKGIALGLGEAGATVYITGRTVEEGKATVSLPGNIHDTAAEVEKLGGRCVPVRCDHRDDSQARGVFEQILRDHGRLDILVNNVWGGYEFYNDGTEFWLEKGFWTAPISRWDLAFAAGVRAHYVCSLLAAPIMVGQKSGLIVTVSFIAAFKPDMGVAYGAAKAADDHMIRCTAHELREHNVATVGLYPGLVRTEAVMKARDYFGDAIEKNSESPHFLGRAVAALAADSNVMSKTGQMHYAAELGEEYNFTDIDGKRPKSIRAQTR